MADSKEKFVKFDFANSSQWQDYLKNIYPTPTYSKLDYLKQKWYKKNIDPAFEVQQQPQQQQQQQSQPQTEQNASPSSQQQKQEENQKENNQANDSKPEESKKQSSAESQEKSQNKEQEKKPETTKKPSSSSSSNKPQQEQQQRQNVSLLYHVEGMAKVSFFGSAFFLMSFYTKCLATLVCALAVIRNKGFPKLSKQYFSEVLRTEFFLNLFYILTLAIPPGRHSLLFFLPLGIHFLSGTAEYLLSIEHAILKISAIKQLMIVIKSNRNTVIQMKQKIEIYLFFYTLIGVFIGTSSLLQLLFMFNYLSFKSKSNPNMATAQQEFTGMLTNFSNSQVCPGLVKFIIQKFVWAYQKLLTVL